VYLRESRRRNKDGTVVSYLQLAHNERHPRTGSPVAKVIRNFGRADLVDREALARLVASISRFLTGKLQPRRSIPSIRTLAEQYGIAKETAAKAIAVLSEEGLVRMVRGRGWFVAPRDSS
jgi:transcription initiation factor TFIIIB Brf1 subunit/transcription initiation factor TFIIB